MACTSESDTTVPGGTSQACAACKFQRRKCTSTCQLTRYFPADDPDKFLNVHRLYGVRNVMSLLKVIQEPLHRDACMKSIIYESEMRKRDPVHGCFGVTAAVKKDLMEACQELQQLWQELALRRRQAELRSRQVVTPPNQYPFYQQQQPLSQYPFDQQQQPTNQCPFYHQQHPFPLSAETPLENMMDPHY